MNRKFPTIQDQDAKKWSCPLVSGPSSQGPNIAVQDNDTCMLTRIYRSFVGMYGHPHSLSPSAFLMHQVSRICLLLWQEKIFPKSLHKILILWCACKSCITLYKFLGNMQFFFGFLKNVRKGVFLWSSTMAGWNFHCLGQDRRCLYGGEWKKN